MKNTFRALLVFLLTYTQAFAGSPMIWNGTRGKELTSKGFLLSDNSVIDNDGALNYIKNGHGEVGTTGWSTYNGGTTTPTSCTGGSPNNTLTRTTSSPLVGAGSLLVTKTGTTSRQGDGISYPFTLDNAYTGLPVSISMLTNASAGYAASDIGVYVYDVTNSQLISPSAVNIAASGYQYQAFFVASTSTSYRLCVHTQTTSAVDYTLKLDSVYVGPTKVVSGLGATDWNTSLTFTPSAGFGTVTSSIISSQRVGNMLRVKGSFACGTVAGTTASIALPTGLTIDYTKINTRTNGQSVGRWYRETSAGATSLTAPSYQAPLFIDGSDTSNVYWAQTSGTQAFEKDVVNNIYVSSNGVAFEFEVPISQWSSNTTMADRALEECSYNTSTNDAADTTSFGYGCGGGAVPGALTAARKKRVRFQNTIQPTDTILLEFKDSSITGGNWAPAGSFSQATTDSINTFTFQNTANYGVAVIPVNTTDVDVYFAQYAQQAGATYGSAGSGWAGYSNVKYRVRKITGGASAGYPVNLTNLYGGVAIRYHIGGGNQAVNTAQINYDTLDYDSCSTACVTTGASWKFTAPVGGYYMVAIGANITSGSAADVRLYKNGSAVLNLVYPTTTVDTVGGSALIYLAATDYIDIRYMASATLTSSSTPYNYVSIFKIAGL